MTLLHFKGWPDCDVPETDEEMEGFNSLLSKLVNFYKVDTTALRKPENKAIVHCRQGHGRTGTLVTILTRKLQEHFNTYSQISLLETLKHLRTQRYGLIEMRA